VGVLINDEPTPQSIWRACLSRRRMGMLALLPMTPLDCEPYIIDEVKEAADNKNPRYAHVIASVYEACKRRGRRGHLDPDVIDGMVEDYDPEEREARVFGNFMYFSGKIFPEYDPSRHFVKPEDYPIRGSYKLFQVTDPHDSRPNANLWAARTEKGRWIIFAETPTDKSRPFWDFKEQRTISQECAEWNKIESRFTNRNRITRVLDKRFGWQQRGERTLASIYAKNGFNFIKSYTSNFADGEIAFGHKLVREALGEMKDGKPGLVIWNTCYHVHNGMKHYIRRKRTGKESDKFATADGKIVEKYKDYPDIVRYLVANDVSHTPREERKSEEDAFLDSILEDSHGDSDEYEAKISGEL